MAFSQESEQWSFVPRSRWLSTSSIELNYTDWLIEHLKVSCVILSQTFNGSLILWEDDIQLHCGSN